jgi:subtilisin-like proprotein convertase family protein
MWLNNGINIGVDRDGHPALAIQQGTTDGRVAGGSLVAVWSADITPKPPGTAFDQITASPVSPMATQSFLATNPGIINDATPGAAITQAFTANNTPIAFNDGATAIANIPVTMSASQIVKVTVNVNIQESTDGDVRLTLIAPDNTQVVLANLNGGSNMNFTNITFDDNATNSISNFPIAGVTTYKPIQPLSILHGENPNGTWQLKVEDLQPSHHNVGQVESVSLSINATASQLGVTNFTIPVTFTNTNFTTLSDMEVVLNLMHPNLSQIKIELIAPNGLGT